MRAGAMSGPGLAWYRSVRTRTRYTAGIQISMGELDARQSVTPGIRPIGVPDHAHIQDAAMKRLEIVSEIMRGGADHSLVSHYTGCIIFQHSGSISQSGRYISVVSMRMRLTGRIVYR